MNNLEIKKQKIIERIEIHGLKFISFEEEKIGTNAKVKVECQNKHIWITEPRNFLDVRRINRPSKGCPMCVHNYKITKNNTNTRLESKKQEVIQKVEMHGFKLISFEEEKIGINSKVKVECSDKHVWITEPRNFLDSRRKNRSTKGCPICAALIVFKNSLEIVKERIPENYILYAPYTKFVNRKEVKNKLCWIIQCNNGHTFEKETGQMQYVSCPKCSEKTFIAQERVRMMLEKHFGRKFITIRPSWLKNPISQRSLELDGYCEDLKIAFEFQGRQHFSNDTQYAGDYEKQSIRDNYKKSKCDELGIQLITLAQPSNYNHQNFFKSIKEQLSVQKIELNFSLSDVDFNTINDEKFFIKKHEEFEQYVKEKGFLLQSKTLSSIEDVLDFSCPNHHQFQMSGLKFKNYFKNEKFHLVCKECFTLGYYSAPILATTPDTIKNDTVSVQPQIESSSITLVKHTLEEASVVKDVTKEIPEINMVPNPINTTQNLNKKKFNQVINLQTCQEIAKLLNFTCMSQEYQNVNTLLEWKCSYGHKFIKSYRQLERNQTGKYCEECEKLGNTHPEPLSKVLIKNEDEVHFRVGAFGKEVIYDKKWVEKLLSPQNITFLDPAYKGMDSKHQFVCSKGHQFESTITNLKDKKERNTSFCSHKDCNGITVINLETCQNFAKENGLICLSNEYKNVHTAMKWSCEKGHLFEKNYRQFLRATTKNYCPHCQ